MVHLLGMTWRTYILGLTAVTGPERKRVLHPRPPLAVET